MGKKYQLYHSTPSENIPPILEKGIIPRGEEACQFLIDEILKEFTWDRETLGKRREWMWKHPLRRCLDTSDRISVSGDILYSVQNCRAGLEAEHDLRRHLGYLASRYKRKPHEIPVSRPSCSVCIIEVDENMPFGDERRGEKNIKELLGGLRERYKIMNRKWPGDEEVLRQHLELNYARIETDEIKECRSAESEEMEISKRR